MMEGLNNQSDDPNQLDKYQGEESDDINLYDNLGSEKK